MAIAYQTISTVATKTTTTANSLTLNAPAGAATDDLLVACISFRGATTPSIPADWAIINRTQVTGNTATNATSIGSGLMAWIKRGATNPSFVFGATTGQQFPNLAFGFVVRISGQDLTDSVLGTSVNTLATGASGLIETGGFGKSYLPAAGLTDSVEIMLCMGGQEVTWSDHDYIQSGDFEIKLYTEIGESTSTSGADGSISVAYIQNVGGLFSGFDSYSATTSAINSRHSLIVASFGGPRPPAVGYSFSTLF
jgi:hypothetical protein